MNKDNTLDLIKNATERLNKLGREIFTNYKSLEINHTDENFDTKNKLERDDFLKKLGDEPERKIKNLCIRLDRPENSNIKLEFLCFLVDSNSDVNLRNNKNFVYILKNFSKELMEIALWED